MTTPLPSVDAAAQDHEHHHDHDHDHDHAHDGDHGDELAGADLDHDHGHDHGDDHAHGTGPLAALTDAVRNLIRPHSHDHAESFDSAMESDARGVRALKISLLGLGITAVIQLALTALTGSVALLADSLHNVADALTAIPIWIAFVLARRAASPRFQFGYGRAEDLAGLIVLVFIGASALIAAIESANRLANPTEVRYLGVVALAGIIGFAGNEAVAQYRIRVGRRIGSAALVADGLHARTDGITSLGVVAGAAGVALGFPAADPIAGLIISVMILIVLRDAARQVLVRMMDGVDPGISTRVAALLGQVPGVEQVGDVRARWIGHRLRVEAAIVVDCGRSVGEAHQITEAARHSLLHGIPNLGDAFIHADPCGHDGVDPHADVAHHATGGPPVGASSS